MTIASTGDVDLSDPATFTNGVPHEHFAHLRRVSPVTARETSAGARFWVVTGHEETAAVLRNARAFSAEYGMTLHTVRGTRDPAAGVMLELTDPPDHGRLRRTIHDFFRPATIALLNKAVTARVAEALDVDGVVDVAKQFGSRLAGDVIAILTGVDADLVPWLIDRAARAFEQPDGAEPGAALRELFIFFGQEIRRRPSAPLDEPNIVEALRGAGLSRREAVANCVNVVAGAATIRNAISGSVVALCDTPEAFTHLRKKPGLLDTAVEELCRWASPALHVARTALSDSTIGAERITAGDVITVWLPSANRDERVFDRADELRLDRSTNPHLAFATGPHACIASHLARLVLKSFLRGLADRFTLLEPISAPHYLASTFVSSVTSFPVLVSRG